MDPAEQGGEPDMVRETRIMAGDGILCKHVKGLELHQVNVETRQGPALMLENVSDARIDGLRMKKRHPNTPVIRVQEVEDLYVAEDRAGDTAYLETVKS